MDELPPPSLPLGTMLGPYRIIELINVGGMAEIYLSEVLDIQGSKRLLALKVIHPEFADDPAFIKMLKDEATLAVTFDHPHIVQTFDLACVDGLFFMPMEFVDGADLFDLLKRVTQSGAFMPMATALYVVQKMLSGLRYAHEMRDAQGQPLGLIHRDISPQNILLSRQGAVKLVDFGIAKVANLSGRTRAGVIKGKLVYMSPEQSFGEAIDQRSDLFSAGVVLYESITGRSLYVENNPVLLIQMVRRAEIPPASSLRPDLDPNIDALLARALCREPEGRFQSAGEFGAAISIELDKRDPNYDARALGEYLSSALAGKVKPPKRVTMRREQFPNPRHSVISSKDEMNVPRNRPPSSPAATQDVGEIRKGRVILFGENGETTSYDINEQFVLGRGGDLRLSDGRVSRSHARIVLHEGAYLIEDLKSSNGTYLNDDKLKEIAELSHGDRIRVGPFHLQFSLEETSKTELAPPAINLESRVPAATAAATAPRASAHAHEEKSNPEAVESTAPQANTAYFKTSIGEETLRLPVGKELPLGLSLRLGEELLDGPGALVVFRDQHHWVEPVPHRETIVLNGKKLDRPARLSSGDRIEVGTLQLEFVPPSKG